MDKSNQFERLQQSFLDELSFSGRSINTIKNYKTDLECFNKFVRERKQKISLNGMTTAEVLEYQNYIFDKYTSSNSRRRRVQALRLFFDYLIKEKIFDHNPIKKIAVSEKVIEKPNPTSFESIIKMLHHLTSEYLEKTNLEKLLVLRNILLIHLIYEGGLKVSDISKLKKEYIAIDKKNIARVLIAREKREPYTIKLSAGFSHLYSFYLSELDAFKKKLQIDFDEIFFNANPFKISSGGLSPRGIEVIFHDLSKELKTKVTARSLRQSSICYLLEEKHPDSTIKEWLGVAPNYSLTSFKEYLLQNKNIHFTKLPLARFL